MIIISGILFFSNSILLYNLQGQLKNTFLIDRQNTKPRGISADDKELYICDYRNDCVVILEKGTGKYKTEWGKKGYEEGNFMEPTCIYIYDNIYYVGDYFSIQLFTKKGHCLQRLERIDNVNISGVISICILKGCLCISEYSTRCVRVFR